MKEQRFLLDTQIWVDLYLKRGSKGVYGEQALQLISKIVREDGKVAFSNIHRSELMRLGMSEYELNRLITLIKPDHIMRLSATKMQFRESGKIAQSRDVPVGDVLHAIMARDVQAVLVSRDEKDFGRLKDVVVFRMPIDLI